MPAEERGDREWLLEPVGANEVRVHVDVGEGVEISHEARTALETFLEEMASAEVEGFAIWPSCPELNSCGRFHCTLGKCDPLQKAPCFADVNCTIANLA